MKKRFLYLKQLFEDGGTGGAGGTGDSGAGGAGGTGGSGTEPEGEKKYSDADIDRIINKKFAEWQKKQQKAVDEAAKLAGMNAQQRAEHDRDAWEQKYNDLLAQNTKATLTVQATKMLADADVTGMPDEIISVLVTDAADTTKKNVDAFVKAFKAAVQAAVKTANKKPSPKAGSASGSLTKADIMKVEDINERQRLIRENYDLFRK